MSERAIAIDTETTGLKAPAIVELGWTEELDSPAHPLLDRPRRWSVRYNPGKPIDLGALATHHILFDEVKGEPVYDPRFLPMDFPRSYGYLLGHNIDYDWGAMGKPNTRRICTLALSRKHFPQCDSHSLIAMTYYVAMCREQDLMQTREFILTWMHNTRGDLIMTTRLCLFIAQHLKVDTWERLWELSEIARVPVFMDFGKYGPDSDWARDNPGQRMPCAKVMSYDRPYFNWLMQHCQRVLDDPYLQKALRGAEEPTQATML